MKKCNECKYCLLIENGYSNYTVEGVEVECLKNGNPNFPVDHWYGHEKTLEFAENCELFLIGNPITIDVERELANGEESMIPKAYATDEETQNLLEQYYNA